MQDPLTVDQSREDHARRRAFMSLFPAIFATFFMGLADSSLIAIALPDISRDFGTSEGLWLVLVCYMIASMVVMPVYGALGDIFGRREMLMVSVVVFVLSACGAAFATSLDMLCFWRVLQGMGGGGLVVLSHALVGETVPGRERGRYQGYISGIALGANGLGPVVGGRLIETFGWQAAFLLHLPIAAFALWMASRFRGQPGRGGRFRPDLVGLALLAGAISLLLWLLQLVQAEGQTSMLPWVLVVLAAVLAVFLMQQRLRPAPLFPAFLFRNRSVRNATLAGSLHGGCYVSLLVLIPMLYRVRYELSAGAIGTEIFFVAFALVIGAGLAGRLISATGHTTLWGITGMTAVTLLLGAVALWPDLSLTQMRVAMTLAGFLCGTVMGGVQVVVQVAAGAEHLATASASLQFSRMLGTALGTAIVNTGLTMYLTRHGGLAEFTGRLLQELPDGATLSAAVQNGLSVGLLLVAVQAGLTGLFLMLTPLRRL